VIEPTEELARRSPMDIGGWIPQIFYDLIGRVVPGAFLLLLCLLLFLDPASAQAIAVFLFKKPGIPFTAILLSGLIVAYVAGALLGAVGFAVWHKEWATSLAKLRIRYPEADKPGTGVALMYDYILLKEPTAGARVVKLRAEQHMCRTLIVGTLIIFLVYCWMKWPPWDSVQHLVTVAGLAFIASAAHLFNVHLTQRSHLLMMNYWHLLHEPDGSMDGSETVQLSTRRRDAKQRRPDSRDQAPVRGASDS
jgi:hypothetical protein